MPVCLIDGGGTRSIFRQGVGSSDIVALLLKERTDITVEAPPELLHKLLLENAPARSRAALISR